MAIPPRPVQEIENWLATQFLGAEVSSYEIDKRCTVLFRARIPGNSPSYELEVTEEAIEDHDSRVILSDLAEQRVAERLRRDPTMRLRYYTRREIPHYEELVVECGGRRYRIIRDHEHVVRLFDSNDQLLTNMPPMLVMSSSIFRKHEQEWCGEILSWRGELQ